MPTGTHGYPAFTIASQQRFIELLLREKRLFGKDEHIFSGVEKDTLQDICAVLRGDMLSNLSRSRRLMCTRANSRLKEIYNDVGQEVFLLCAMGISITRLGHLPSKGLVAELAR